MSSGSSSPLMASSTGSNHNLTSQSDIGNAIQRRASLERAGSLQKKRIVDSNSSDLNEIRTDPNFTPNPGLILSTKSPRQILIKGRGPNGGYGFTLRHFIVYPPEVGQNSNNFF